MKQAIVLITAALLTLALDYGTKEAAFRAVSMGESRAMIDDFLWNTPRLNEGAAFSFLAGTAYSNWILLGLTAVLLPLLIGLHVRRYRAAPSWAFGLVVGGALGNAVDRILVGGVRDFLDVHWWPTFNIADAAIAGGVGVLLFWSLFVAEKHKRHRVL